MGFNRECRNGLSNAGTGIRRGRNPDTGAEHEDSGLFWWGKLDRKTAGLCRQTRFEGCSPIAGTGNDPLGGSGDAVEHRATEAGGRTSHRRHPFRGRLISVCRLRSANLVCPCEAVASQIPPVFPVSSVLRPVRSTVFDATTVRQGAYAKNFATNSNCRNSVGAQEILRFMCHSAFFCGASPSQPVTVTMFDLSRDKFAVSGGSNCCNNSRPGGA